MDERALVKDVLEAFERSLDADRLGKELSRRLGSAAKKSEPLVSAAPSLEKDELLGKLVLADLLDDAILGARPGDKEFPLRLLLAKLGETLSEEASLSFACGLGFYFRAPMDEETKLRLGLEVSRAFYAFAAAAGLEQDALFKASPLLAALMSSELTRLRFESVDHAAVFDSTLHERDSGSDQQSSRVLGARSFLCRVTASDKVRAKAVVRT